MASAGGTPGPGRVLVTNGEFKHTLGIVRALAARGHEVHVIARSRSAPAVHSKAVTAWHQAPPPGAPESGARLIELATPLAPTSLIPVGNGAVAAADRARDELPVAVRFALPRRDRLATANDKVRTASLAKTVSVST